MSITITKSPYIVNKEYLDNSIQQHSNHSYFAGNNKITSIFSCRSLAGQECFITAGGPSLQNFDYSRLQGKFTIGINKSFTTYSPNINYSMDSSFFGEMTDGTMDEVGKERTFTRFLNSPSRKVFLTPLELKIFSSGDIYLVKRKSNAEISVGDLNEGIYPGQNSGFGSINLAVALGSTKIYLLGYDLCCTDRTHNHSGYKDCTPDSNGQNTWVARDPKLFNKKLGEFKKEIEDFSPIWKEAGINIINLNPNSALTCFPFGDIDKVLGEKSANLP